MKSTLNFTLTDDQVQHLINDMFCNGMYYLGSYGIEMQLTEQQYMDAKNRLLKDDPNRSLCREDIWIQILNHGDSIKFWDNESEEQYEMTLESIHENFEHAPECVEHIMDSLNDQGDAITGDCLFQTALLGQIIYG